MKFEIDFLIWGSRSKTRRVEKQPSKWGAEKIARLPRRLLIALIRAYQWGISPWLGAHCRHIPTCSNYSIEAIREWGIFRGGWMAIRRIGSCHPWGSDGYDPVPRKERSSEPESELEAP
ncbi:MAG: membrane protein insertion efficiency factor YidD [Balneolaceae bacterium]